MEGRVIDLPFKIGDTAIVIVRARFRSFSAVSAEKPSWKMLRWRAAMDRSAELDVVRYAAQPTGDSAFKLRMAPADLRVESR
jgi:hypothetical protein